MYFKIEYEPYIAIIGDIKDSKDIVNRYDTQETLKDILSKINTTYSKEIASKFVVTLGDEFQGLLKDGSVIIPIINEIEKSLHPVKMRFGIGVGEIHTSINYEMAIGSDGPCFYKAREAILSLKNKERKKEVAKSLYQLEVDGKSNETVNLINTIFTLMTAIKESWSDRQRETILNLENHNDGQSEVARRMGIRQSSVQKHLVNAKYYTYKEALDIVTEALSEIGRQND